MEKVIRLGVKALIVHEGRVLIIKRSGYDGVMVGDWECPGGGMEFGETFEEAMVREAREEVGLDVAVKAILFATTYPANERRQLALVYYLCEPRTLDVKLSEEHTDYLWVNAEELRKNLLPVIYGDIVKYGMLAKLNLQ